MKLLSVVGARPQFVKASALSRAIAAEPGWQEVLVHTGQHFDPAMSAVFFEELEIPPPQHHLGVHSLPHGAMTGRMLEGLEKIIAFEKPDLVLVYGDTNSTLAGALAAAKMQLPVAHVEAGLRSYNRAMPEELNRLLTDQLSHWLLVPGASAQKNLLREGLPAERIHLVGDIMQEVLAHFRSRALALPTVHDLALPPKYALLTLHREALLQNPAQLAALGRQLKALSRKMPLICPLHPRLAAQWQALGWEAFVKPLPPQSYLAMQGLLHHCQIVLTDSGGLQKEAFYAGRPCLSLRTETEWTELLELGVNRLVAAPFTELLPAVEALLAVSSSAYAAQPYGDSAVSARILKALGSSSSLLK